MEGMNEKELDSDGTVGMDSFFRAARESAQEPSELLTQAMLVDAAALQPRREAIPKPRIFDRLLREWLRLSRRWKPAGALAATAIAGMFIGYVAVDNFAIVETIVIGDVADTSTPDVFAGLEELLLEG